MKLRIWGKAPRQLRWEQQPSSLKTWKLGLGNCGFGEGKKRSALAAQALPRAGSGHSSWVSGGNVHRPVPPHPLQSKFQGQSTESSTFSPVGVSLLSESDIQESKVFGYHTLDLHKAQRKGSCPLHKHPCPRSCATSHREPRGSERLTGPRSHS